MASYAKQNGVIVHLSVPAGVDKESEPLQMSCSGTFMDRQNGLIITSGLIFAPLLQSKAESPDENYHQRKLHFVFSKHGKILRRNEFCEKIQLSSAGCSGDELLDHIEGMCNIKVYVQNHNSQIGLGPRKGGSGDAAAAESKNLFSISISGNSSSTKKLDSKSDSSHDKCWAKKPVNILAIWRCPALASILENLLVQSSGWSLSENDPKNGTEAEEQTRNLLPFFALLKLKPDSIVEEYINIPFKLHNQLNKTLGPFLFSALRNNGAHSNLKLASKLLSKWVVRLSKRYKPDDLVSYAKSALAFEPGKAALGNFHAVYENVKKLYGTLPGLNAGDPLFTVATPFGSLSPTVFLNSISKGILTNLAGDNQVLVMTDARCVPGCEGGGIYLETQANDSQLIGVIIAPFCWRQNEWVGLTFAVNLRPLLSSLFDAVSHNPGGKDPDPESRTCTSTLSEMSDLIENVALLKVGSRWGSAVLVRLAHGTKRLLLTCCHVVQKKAGATVQVLFRSRAAGEASVEANEIYCTPAGRVYDLAVLEVDSKHHGQLPRGIEISSNFALEGEQILAIGHGLFDDHTHLPASVTSGIISKILCKDGKQVLIQSTCAVHPGASGGALINEHTRQLCGIIVCNTKDAVCSASYPHINLSIPSTIILPALNEYAVCGDPKALDQLHDPDPVISSYWQLGYNQIGKLKSKL